jgi:DNA-binding FrmR family transcriptional regulator
MKENHEHQHSHNHGTGFHRHVHSKEEKQAVLNRLSRAAGHLESIKTMVINDEDCSQILVQLAAVRSAINNTGKLVLKNHIDHCLVEAVEQGDEETIQNLKDSIDKFVK